MPCRSLGRLGRDKDFRGTITIRNSAGDRLDGTPDQLRDGKRKADVAMPSPVEFFSGEMTSPSDCLMPIVTKKMAAAASVITQALRPRCGQLFRTSRTSRLEMTFMITP